MRANPGDLEPIALDGPGLVHCPSPVTAARMRVAWSARHVAEHAGIGPRPSARRDAASWPTTAAEPHRVAGLSVDAPARVQRHEGPHPRDVHPRLRLRRARGRHVGGDRRRPARDAPDRRGDRRGQPARRRRRRGRGHRRGRRRHRRAVARPVGDQRTEAQSDRAARPSSDRRHRACPGPRALRPPRSAKKAGASRLRASESRTRGAGRQALAGKIRSECSRVCATCLHALESTHTARARPPDPMPSSATPTHRRSDEPVRMTGRSSSTSGSARSGRPTHS